MPALVFIQPVSDDPAQAVIAGNLDLDALFADSLDSLDFLDKIDRAIDARYENAGIILTKAPDYVISDFKGFPANFNMTDDPEDFIQKAYAFLEFANSSGLSREAALAEFQLPDYLSSL